MSARLGDVKEKLVVDCLGESVWSLSMWPLRIENDLMAHNHYLSALKITWDFSSFLFGPLVIVISTNTIFASQLQDLWQYYFLHNFVSLFY